MQMSENNRFFSFALDRRLNRALVNDQMARNKVRVKEMEILSPASLFETRQTYRFNNHSTYSYSGIGSIERALRILGSY